MSSCQQNLDFHGYLDKITDLSYEPSRRYDLSKEGLLELPFKGVGLVNGMNNTLEESMAAARYVSKLAGGCNVYGVYNARLN